MIDIKRLQKLAGLNESVTQDDIENVMFGDLKGNQERDTPTEEELFVAIKRFISSATPRSKGVAVNSLNDLQHLKSQYPDDLIPDAKVVYRGTQLKQSEYESLLGKIDPKNSPEWIEIPFQYMPKSNIQSWTTSKTIAIEFAVTGDSTPLILQKGPPENDWSDSYPFPAVIQVNVDDSFILSTKLTGKIAQKHIGKDEKEIVRIKQTAIQGTALIHFDWLQSYANMRPNK
jgi:hypothetical protein